MIFSVLRVKNEIFRTHTDLKTPIVVIIMLLFGLSAGAWADVANAFETPVIGIAWRADTDSEFFTNICRAVEESGGTWTMLEQVRSADLEYDSKGCLKQGGYSNRLT